MPQANPLCKPIEQCLQEQPGGFTEFELHRRLEGLVDGFPPQHHDADLALFQRHFLVMNGLYQLQPVFAQRQQRLVISALRIALEPLTGETGAGLPVEAAEQKLREYYLDWSVLEQACGDQVRRLLDRFWQRMACHERASGAYATLDLAEGTAWAEIRARYRALAAEYHPDRGGSAQRFNQIRQAYETLKRSQGR